MSRHRRPTDLRRKRWLVAGAAALVALPLAGAVAVATDDGDTWQNRLGAQGATIDAQVAGLQAQIDQLTTDRDQLLLSNQDLSSQVAGLNSQLAAVTAERDALKAQLPSASASPSPSPTPTSSPSAPTASMPVGSSLYSGTSETPQQSFDRRCTDWGACPEIVRYFYPGLPSGGWPTLGNSVSVVSFKAPSVSQFAAGAYDTQVKAWLNVVPADGRPHYVAFFHEPEDDIIGGAFTAAQFRDAALHLQQLVASYQGSGKRLKAGVILMGWTVDARSGRDVNNYLVPSMDFIGWDIYTGLTDAEISRDYTPAANVCASRAVAKCFLTETAPNSSVKATQAQTASYITASTQVARGLGFDGYMYFDSTVGGDFRLTAQVAFQAMSAEIAK